MCTNSYSKRYQGTYSEKYICNEEGTAINATAYWGHNCLANPILSELLFSTDTVYTQCDNSTWGSSQHNLSLTTEAPVNTIDNNNTDNMTFTEWDCFNWTYAGIVDLHCDSSLPPCKVANYTTLKSLPDARDCTTDKSEANWHTETVVVQQCYCFDTDIWFDPEADWNITYLNKNETFCSNYLCDEDGIWWVEYYFVDTTKPQSEWCATSMKKVYELNDTTNIDPTLIIPAGCDKKSGQWTEIAYCPQDDEAMERLRHSVYKFMILSMIMVLYNL